MNTSSISTNWALENMIKHERKINHNAFAAQAKAFIALVLSLLLVIGCSGCSNDVQTGEKQTGASSQTKQVQNQSSDDSDVYADDEEEIADEESDPSANSTSSADNGTSGKSTAIKNGVPSSLKGNWTSQSNGLYYTCDKDPNFSASLKNKSKSFEDYAKLDYLGRCGPALACIGLDLMPTGGRGNISEVKPTGWHTYYYDFINGGSLYNRCHLIAYSLAGENANARNLITGTRQMNEAMIMFENIVSNYVTGSGNHCLYRVTPVFLGKELVARGVHMEAYSVEDKGTRVNFNVYLPNKQDKVKINYLTGESSLKSNASSSSNKSSASISNTSKSSNSKSSSSAKSNKSNSSNASKTTYVLNTSSYKFHYPDCSAVKRMAEHNKSVVKDKRSAIIKKGYDSCGICNP